ncbi:MAG: hypothetical protein EXR86_13605 [Gammaproteobacteria bacterium]|nr:hypothetical protein [Gammaproteobacteria bacterium]
MNDLLDARRIRERVPFNQLSAEQLKAVIASGKVTAFEAGIQVFVRNRDDQHVHYLHEGAISLTVDNSPAQTVYTYQEAALLPLDEAGIKTHTVTAIIPSRIFRIAPANLQGAASSKPPSSTSEIEIARALYTNTVSGEQLAQLVDALHADRKRLVPDLDPHPQRSAQDGVRFGETTMKVRLDAVVPEIEMAAPTPPPPQSSLPRDDVNDEISGFARELEGRFWRYVEQVRAQERQRAQAQLQNYVKRLQQLAEQQLRAKIETVRERYQAAHLAKEKKLRERYEHLIAMANKMTRQKAAIYQARRQLEDKLRLAEQVHNELAQIGLNVTRQLNDLEELIPDESNEPQ